MRRVLLAPALLVLAGAIAAGCSCIIKPSEETPGTTIAMMRALEDAGLPAGVMNVVFGAALMLTIAVVLPAPGAEKTQGMMPQLRHERMYG